MAPSAVEMLKNFWNSQVMDEEQRMHNYRVLKAVGLFAGSIYLMCNLNVEYLMGVQDWQTN